MFLRESVLRKMIRESIRKKLLTEGVNSHIRSKIEMLNRDYPGWFVRLCKKKTRVGIDARIEICNQKGEWMAHVEFSTAQLKHNSYCGGAYVVNYTQKNKKYDLGINPLAYDILIELLSLMGSGLTADKEEVSHPVMDFQKAGYAHYMWIFYLLKRNDLTKVKLDPEPFGFTKQTDDDCMGVSSFRNWMYDNNELYIKKGGGMKVLPREKKEEFMTTGFGFMDHDPKDFDFYKITHKDRFKKNLSKIPKKYKDGYRKAWDKNELPLMIMLKKEDYPVLNMLKSLNIKFVNVGNNATATKLYNMWKSLGASTQKTSQKGAEPKTRKPKQSTRPEFDPDKDWEIYQKATNYGKRQLVKKWISMGIKKAKRSWQRSDLDI